MAIIEVEPITGRKMFRAGWLDRIGAERTSHAPGTSADGSRRIQ